MTRTICESHCHFNASLGVTSDAEKVYGSADLYRDIAGTGVQSLVHVECGTNYYTDGPELMRPVGETAFIAATFLDDASAPDLAAAIIGYADLAAGDAIGEVLDAHIEAGRGLFRGLRYSGAFDAGLPLVRPDRRAGMYREPGFLAGFGQFAARGLVFDALLYPPQTPDLVELAQRFPDTQIVFEHFGGIIAKGPFAAPPAEHLARWKADLAPIVDCPNISLKVSALASRHRGLFEVRDTQYSVAEAYEVFRPYFDWAIETLGPSRCLFGSNFPVDKVVISYADLVSAFGSLSAALNAEEQDDLFFRNAERIYQPRSIKMGGS